VSMLTRLFRTVVSAAAKDTGGYADDEMPIGAVSPARAPLARECREHGVVNDDHAHAISAMVIAGPAVASVYYSFTNWSGVGGAKFVGLANYARLFRDPEFATALWHNVLWTAVFLTVPVAIALIGADALARTKRFRKTLSAIFLLPYVVSVVVSASLWRELYASGFGVKALADLAPLGNPNLALWAVALANIRAWWGFLVVVFLAALQSVPADLYEAAALDGARWYRRFRSVSLPGIRPTLFFMLVMSMIWSFLVFNWVFIMTGGGPGDSTQVVASLLYQNAFQNQQVGYAAAMAMVPGLIATVLAAGYTLVRRRGCEV
jgi:raffinose/stachyose/melibiose transport system permease protein